MRTHLVAQRDHIGISPAFVRALHEMAHEASQHPSCDIEVSNNLNQIINDRTHAVMLRDRMNMGAAVSRALHELTWELTQNHPHPPPHPTTIRP